MNTFFFKRIFLVLKNIFKPLKRNHKQALSGVVI